MTADVEAKLSQVTESQTEVELVADVNSRGVWRSWGSR